MASIYLIRHGQASFGQENYDQLSELGHQQSELVGQAMSERIERFDAVHLGTLHRHQQTAEACLGQFTQSHDQNSMCIDAGWNEYDHQNILAQLRPELETAASTEQFVRQQSNPKQAYEQIFVDAIDRWASGKYDEEYIESWTDYSQRVRTVFDKVAQSSVGLKNVAVFTSGGPISLVSQSLLGVAAEKIMQLNWTLVNCGVTKLVSTGSRVFLASLNEHVHFEGDKKSYITYR